MLLRRASPESEIASSKTGIYFCTDPKSSKPAAILQIHMQAKHFLRRQLAKQKVGKTVVHKSVLAAFDDSC